MQKSDFALSWYAPPAQVDWNNLIASTCRRVLLGYSVAKSQPNVLARLHGLGCKVVLRIEQDNQEPPAQLAQELNTLYHIIPIDAVIIGTEPDAGVDFTYRETNDPNAWGQNKAYASAARVNPLVQAIKGLGLLAVAPAMSWPPEMISEDGKLLPGRTTFREIVAPTYHKADGVGNHCGYVLGWDGNAVNPWRFKNGLKRNAEEWHKPLWIDECTFPTDDDMLQMKCACDLADITMASRCNDRVELLSPFCSTGFPTAWPARYLIKDPAAYDVLRQWLAR